MKSVTQEQHIDYQFISLEDDESEDVEDDDYSDEDDSSGTSSAEDEEESRFDCRRNDRQLSFASAARYTLQVGGIYLLLVERISIYDLFRLLSCEISVLW